MFLARAVDIINYIDNTDHQDSNVYQKVDDCCAQLEALVAEWNMEPMLADLTYRLPLRYLVADHFMNIYAIIIGLKRLANRVDGTDTIDSMTVRAARTVVGTLLDFEQSDSLDDWEKLGPSKFVVGQ
jgi:hypothetical protein